MKRTGFRPGFAVILGVVLFAVITILAHLRERGSDPSPEIAARVGIQALKNALDMYQVDHGSYPQGSNGLQALLVAPTNSSVQYVDKIPLDPWGNQYRYECPGTHNTNSFDLSSVGLDGVFGTADDIGNWDKSR